MKKHTLSSATKLLFLALLSPCIVHSQPSTVTINRTVDQVQPLTGLVLWNYLAEEENASYGSCFGLEYTYCKYSDVVTGKKDGKIQYNWSSLESTLNDVQSRGHQAVLRFWFEYPGEQPDGKTVGITAVPKYIKDMSDYKETKYNSGDGLCYYADWSHSELQWFAKQFYTDFAAKYDRDPRIAVMEVGFGHWGEYHISDGPSLKLGKNFPSKDYQEQFLTHVAQQFVNMPWCISVDAAETDQSAVTQRQSLKALHFGVFDDSFMCNGHDLGSKTGEKGYNEENWNAIGNTRWKTAPCGGEISYYKSSDQHNFLNPDGMYNMTWEGECAHYHISFMICNDALEGKYATTTRFKQGSMACGYHFQLTACQTDGNKTLVTVTNTGVAPIYKDAYFAIGSVRATESLKGLLPNATATFTIPVGLSKADDLHIVSDFIYSTQQIQFDANVTVTVVPTALDSPIHPLIEGAGGCSKIIKANRLYIFRHGRTYTPLGM